MAPHAAGVETRLFQIDTSGQRSLIFETRTDEGGRFSEEVGNNSFGSRLEYEIVFQIANYFSSHGLITNESRIVTDAVIRFAMPDSNARYHFPLMIAPNGYSVWWPE